MCVEECSQENDSGQKEEVQSFKVNDNSQNAFDDFNDYQSQKNNESFASEVETYEIEQNQQTDIILNKEEFKA